MLDPQCLAEMTPLWSKWKIWGERTPFSAWAPSHEGRAHLMLTRMNIRCHSCLSFSQTVLLTIRRSKHVNVSINLHVETASPVVFVACDIVRARERAETPMPGGWHRENNSSEYITQVSSFHVKFASEEHIVIRFELFYRIQGLIVDSLFSLFVCWGSGTRYTNVLFLLIICCLFVVLEHVKLNQFLIGNI